MVRWRTSRAPRLTGNHADCRFIYRHLDDSLQVVFNRSFLNCHPSTWPRMTKGKVFLLTGLAMLNAFFEKATPQDISALLARTNYDFYKHVRPPAPGWFDLEFMDVSEFTLEIPVIAVAHHGGVPNRPVIYIGRGCQAADHQDLALAA